MKKLMAAIILALFLSSNVCAGPYASLIAIEAAMIQMEILAEGQETDIDEEDEDTGAILEETVKKK